MEIEAFACAVLAAQMENGALDDAPIWTDARTFDGTAWRGAVDCVIAGFPCQDISSAGKRAGIHGKRSGLWFDVARIIRDVRPRVVFLENVDALIVRGVDSVLGSLAELGCDAVWDVFSAAEVGAPHLRERWFCLAVNNGWGVGQADAPRFGRREGRTASARLSGRSDAAERGAPLDGADTGRHWQNDSVRSGQSRPERTSAVADACGGGHHGWTPESGGRSWRRGSATRTGEALGSPNASGLSQRVLERPGWAAPETGGVLADADATGLGLEWRSRVFNGQRTAHRNGADGRECPSAPLGPWPPGPDDRQRWAAVVEADAHLAPALAQSQIRRMVDGLALGGRVDWLRLLGNGVVPQQAAYAYRVLRARLIDERLWPWEVIE